MTLKEQEKFAAKVKSDVEKIKRAKEEQGSLFAQTVYLGVLGFIFILPVVVCAYLGVWLDNKLQRYFSISWTVSLIFLGVIIGAVNVYFFIKDRE